MNSNSIRVPKINGNEPSNSILFVPQKQGHWLSILCSDIASRVASYRMNVNAAQSLLVHLNFNLLFVSKMRSMLRIKVHSCYQLTWVYQEIINIVKHQSIAKGSNLTCAKKLWVHKKTLQIDNAEINEFIVRLQACHFNKQEIRIEHNRFEPEMATIHDHRSLCKTSPLNNSQHRWLSSRYTCFSHYWVRLYPKKACKNSTPVTMLMQKTSKWNRFHPTKEF